MSANGHSQRVLRRDMIEACPNWGATVNPIVLDCQGIERVAAIPDNWISTSAPEPGSL